MTERPASAIRRTLPGRPIPLKEPGPKSVTTQNNPQDQLCVALIVHQGQGLTVDQAVLVVDRATSAEHLYVGMTRGRHHNLACVITDPAGDEHTRRDPPAPDEVLTAALGRTSVEKSATETLREELGQLQPEAGNDAREAIIDGLRQAQANSYDNTLRRHQLSRHMHAFPDHSTAPAVTIDGPDL